MPVMVPSSDPWNWDEATWMMDGKGKGDGLFRHVFDPMNRFFFPPPAWMRTQGYMYVNGGYGTLVTGGVPLCSAV